MPEAIRLAGIVKRFGDLAALDGFSLDVAEGSIFGLLGPSGSGKTTALRVIAGFEAPDEGSVEIGGRTVAGPGVFVPPEKRKVGMVFQAYALFPHLTVTTNVGYGVPTGERARRVAEVLAMVGLGPVRDRLPHELSGGEQQRVALARALAPRPDVVLLDEPFSSLDAPQRERVRREVRAILVEARATAVFVTHDQEEALAVSDRVAVMKAGTVLQVAEPDELYRHPADCWIARFLGEGEFFRGNASGGSVETLLGAFASPTGAEGSVEVMIRPESVLLTPDSKGRATIVDRQFYGHDQLMTLLVDGDHRLLARTGPTPAFRPGDSARFEVTEVVVFPTEGHDHTH